MRRVPALCRQVSAQTVMRVASLAELPSQWVPELAWLVPVEKIDELCALERLAHTGLAGMFVCTSNEMLAGATSLPTIVASAKTIESGDVVATGLGVGLQILYRESDAHHTVFLTNRCNSYCLMCSQPPTSHDDAWLIDQAKQLAAHIRHSPAVLGFTGGEPLLLGKRLREVLETFGARHPSTQFEVLTNGRLFSDKTLAHQLLHRLSPNVCWAVPLYGHADFLHDYVVQSEGAFDETIGGLLTLRAFAQPIQLRVVLIEPTLRILPELCAFITRNLPFVREVALMGCEPIGFALANRNVCEVDIRNWADELSQGVNHLSSAGMRPVLMNLPSCALPMHLRPFAHRSISDWKQAYTPECGGCEAQKDCCGLFASHKRGWRPTILRPLREVTRT